MNHVTWSHISNADIPSCPSTECTTQIKHFWRGHRLWRSASHLGGGGWSSCGRGCLGRCLLSRSAWRSSHVEWVFATRTWVAVHAFEIGAARFLLGLVVKTIGTKIFLVNLKKKFFFFLIYQILFSRKNSFYLVQDTLLAFQRERLAVSLRT